MGATGSSLKPSPPKRRRFQFSLGAIFVVITLVSAGLATWNTLIRPYWTQDAIVEKFLALKPQPKIVLEPATPSWLRWIPGSQRLVKVKSLNLEHYPIKDADLERLPELVHLENLYLADTAVTDKAMERVGRLPNLQRLSLWRTPVTDQGVRRLRNLVSLRRLDIQETSITSSSLAELKTLPKLSVLRHTLILNDTDLQTLARFPKLRQGCSEYLCLTKMTDRGMQSIGRIRGVEWLEISDSQIGRGWKRFGELATLKNLTLARVDIGTEGLRGIAELPRLQSLSLLNVKIAGGWEHTQKMQSLRELTVNATTWSREGASVAANLPDLKRVYLKDANLTIEDAAYAWGDRLTSLRVEKNALFGGWEGRAVEFWPGYHTTDYDLHWLEDLSAVTTVIFCADINPDALDKVAAMPSVERLEVQLHLDDQVLSKVAKGRRIRTLVFRQRHSNITGCESCSPKAFQLLAALSDLERLEFEGHKPTSDQLGVLKELRQLRHLKIADGSQFDDAGMSYLKGLTQLESLEIGNAREITDLGMAHLSQLTALRTIVLRGVNVTDAGLACLAQLPNLEVVELTVQPRISREAVANFQRAHAKCRLSVQ